MNSYGTRLLVAGFIALSLTPLTAQETFTDGGNDGSWINTANWSPTPASSSVVPGITTSAGQNVIIGTVGVTTSANGILVDTASVAAADASVSIGSLTFNNTNPVDLAPLSSETLAVNGNITNTTTVADDLSLPVTVAAAAPTYTGGPGAGTLTFDSALNVGTADVATSGTVIVDGGATLNFTLSAPGTSGSIGTINGSGADVVITLDYTPTTPTSFTLSTPGSFTATTLQNITLPSLTGTGLSWNTSEFVSEGILALSAPANQTLTSPSPTTINIIAGASTPISATLTNSGVVGAAPLNVSLTDGGGTGGTVSGLTPATNSTVAQGTPATVNGTFTAGNTPGTGLTWSITNTDPNALTTTVSTGGTVNIYNHAAPSLTVNAGQNNQVFIIGATGQTAALTLANGTTDQTGLASLDVNSITGATGGTGPAEIATGSSETVTAALNSGTLGAQTVNVSANVGDDATLAGASAPVDLANVPVSYTVLGHAAPALTINAGQNNQVFIVGATGQTATLNLANGTPAQSGLAALDVNSITGATGGTGTAQVASGGSETLTAALNSGTTGVQSVTVSANVGDDHLLAGANPAANLGNTFVSYTVLGHADPTLTLDGGQNNQTFIVGATGQTATLTLANGTPAENGLASLDVNSISGATGTTGSAVVASGGSENLTAALSGATAGLNQTVNVTANVGDDHTLAGANAAANLSNTVVTYNVLGHADPTLTINAGQNNQSFFVGATGETALLTLADGATDQTGLASLDVIGFTNATGNTGSAEIASGGSETVTAALSSGTVGLNQTVAVTADVGDDHTLAGANAPADLSNTIVTYNVVNHATSNLTVGTLDLGNVHVGYTSPVTSAQSLTATNGLVADDRVDLGGSAPADGNVGLTALSGVASGSSGMIFATLATGQGLGAIATGPITYTFADDTDIAGASANVGTAAISVTGQVYSGQSVWNTDGDGSWGTLTGTGASTFGANWGTNQGSPGLDSGFVDTDTATFDNTALTTGASATVSLDGANPSLNAITFNTSGGGGYTITQGSGGMIKLNNGANAATITDNGGDQTIDATVPMELDSNVAVSVANAGDTLTLAGPISESGGSRSFTVSGAGTVDLTGADTYSGATNVQQGTLQLGSGGSLLSTAAVTLGNSATSGVFALGDASGAVSQTVASLAISGTGAANAVVGGNAAVSTLTVNNSSADNFSGLIGGVGANQNNVALVAGGSGTLSLSGASTYTGGTTINAGTLLVGSNAALGAGSVTNTAGILATFGGQHVINVGTALVTSNYTQAAGGTLVIGLNAVPVNGLNAANDLLQVSGTASLLGNLAVNISGFVPTQGQTFTVVETNLNNPANSNGITTLGANFSNPTMVTPAGLTVTGSFTDSDNDLTLTIASTQLALANLPGLSPNQTAIVNYIDQNITSGKLFSYLSQIVVNDPQGAPQVTAEIANELDPIKFGNFARSNAFNNESFNNQSFDSYLESLVSPQGDFQVSNTTVDSSGLTMIDSNMDSGLAQVQSRLLAWNPAPLGHGLLSDSAAPVLGGVDMKQMTANSSSENDRPWNVFVMGNAILGQNFSQVDTAHSDTTTGGGQIGANFRITPHLRVGATFGYSHTDADTDSIGSKATLDSYAPGAFIAFADSGWRVNAMAHYGFDSFTEDRQSSIPGLGVAHGAPSGDEIGADLDGGYDFHVKNLTFGPIAGLQYTHLDVDAFTEGGSLADLNVSKQEADSLRSRLGGHVSYLFHTGTVLLTPHLDASWQHEFMDQSEGLDAQILVPGLAAGTPFSVETPAPSRDSALVDLGLNADLDGQVSVFGDYLVQAGQSNYFGQSVQAGVKIGF